MRRPHLLVVALVATLFILLIPDGLTDSVAEKLNLDSQGESHDRDILTIQDGLSVRNKRAVLAGVKAAAGVVSALFGVGSFIFGLVNGQKRLAELREIKNLLKDLDKKIDGISTDIDSLVAGQERLRATVLYGRDVSRLRFFFSILANTLYVQEDKSLGPAQQAEEWAEHVLDLGSDGVAQILHNFHDMVMGHSPLFRSRPIFIIMEETLNRDSSQYTSQVREIAEYLYSIQVAGYAAWATALNIKGRNSEVPHMQDMGRNRLEAQKAVNDPVMLQWPSGTYGLPKTSSGCPVASGVTWQHGYRYHDTQRGNKWSSNIHFPDGAVQKSGMYQHFCLKTTRPGEGAWPKGNYCIFKKGPCPSGFRHGMVYWDDEDTRNKNKINGYLPDGLYDRNTAVEYCCRSDGPHTNPITLPPQKPFYLFRFTTQCQRVKNMNVVEEFFLWDDENSRNRDETFGAHPHDTGGTRNHKLHYCYYYQ